MGRAPRRGTWALRAALGTIALALNGEGVAFGQDDRRDGPEGPAPIAHAVEIEAGPGAWHDSADAPAAAPAHPPIHQIPPVRMPDETARRASGPGSGISHDSRTGKTRVAPADFGAAAHALEQGGGYRGADGGVGDEVLPALMSGPMSLIANPARASHPWRMNVKLVIRFGNSYGVCSGTMRDIATVLTAGHCLFDFGGAGWADEVWVYPAWDGTGDLIPTPTIANHYGWGSATALASWTGWTQNGDLNYDIGLIAIDRAVGALTGWFGWQFGGECPYWLAQTVSNVSYPAEDCGTPGLHNGRDMLLWSGRFDSCPDFNRIRLDTSPGCYTAIWGGQSGSGVYRSDETDSRLVHAVTSTSNRSTNATYTRQWEAWVTYTQTDFIPNSGRGAAFDLQPLDMNAAPPVVPAGGSVSALLNHLAVNGSNAARSGTWRFRVYLSSNDDISSGDTLLSQQSYDWSFGPVSSARIEMAAVTIPPDTPPGHYYLGVIYDAGTDGNPANDDTDGWDAVPITVPSAIPLLTQSVNGQRPTPPVVTTTGPCLLTLDLPATTYTASLDWYWALIVNGQTLWVTSAGLSVTPAPLLSSPPVVLSNATLLNVNLPPGTTLTSGFFLVNGKTLVSSDFITVVAVP